MKLTVQNDALQIGESATQVIVIPRHLQAIGFLHNALDHTFSTVNGGKLRFCVKGSIFFSLPPRNAVTEAADWKTPAAPVETAMLSMSP